MTAILKRELSGYFKTPVGYLLIGGYALFSGLIFYLVVLRTLTSYMGDYFGLWLFLADIVIVSVLSMKFFAEERKNKTDQLLLTSPASLYGIVAGKFLAALMVFTAAFCVNFVYVLILDIFGDVDYGMLLTNLIGSFLVSAAMIAIALFISSLTESPLASAGVTFAVLFLPMLIDLFSGFMPAFLRRIISALTIYNYYGDFKNGLLSLPALVYYLSITAVFLFLTIRFTEKRRWS